jgi:hypothetical protein
MYNMVLYLCVLIVFSIHQKSLKLILATDPLPRWFCHSWYILGDGPPFEVVLSHIHPVDVSEDEIKVKQTP